MEGKDRQKAHRYRETRRNPSPSWSDSGPDRVTCSEEMSCCEELLEMQGTRRRVSHFTIAPSRAPGPDKVQEYSGQSPKRSLALQK